MHGGLIPLKNSFRKASNARTAEAPISIKKKTSWTYGSTPAPHGTASSVTRMKTGRKTAYSSRLTCTSKAPTSTAAGSILPSSVAVNGYAPYKAVLTHGFTMDGEGRKMSKSVGNVVAPQDIINRYGADVMRLWISSVDYQGDVRLSDKIVKSMSDVYRKIRNTFRYLMGNLYDFDPKKDSVAYEDMEEMDRWALLCLEQVKRTVLKAYEDYEFHVMYHAVHNFCTVDLSAIYLDILKDRLYTEKADSRLRRSAQTAMYEILTSL